MINADLSTGYVAKVHSVIRRALEIAWRRDEVSSNIAKLIDAPGAGDRELEPLTQQEQIKVWWQLQRATWEHGCDDAEAST